VFTFGYLLVYEKINFQNKFKMTARKVAEKLVEHVRMLDSTLSTSTSKTTVLQ
jgi:hypothetical protein